MQPLVGTHVAFQLTKQHLLLILRPIACQGQTFAASLPVLRTVDRRRGMAQPPCRPFSPIHRPKETPHALCPRTRRHGPGDLAADAVAGRRRRRTEVHHHRHRRCDRRLLRRRRRDLPPDEQGPRQARHSLLGRIDRRLGVQHQHDPRRRTRLRRRPVGLAVPRLQRHQGVRQGRAVQGSARGVLAAP